MIVYKLTDQKGQSHGGTQWGENVTHTATGQGLEFCSPALIHAYPHPLLAVLMNPIHATFKNPLLWESEGEVVASNNGLKLGFKTLTTLRCLPLPEVTTEQKVRFSIFCALEVYPESKFVAWAHAWLDGSDRSAKAARAAEAAAEWMEAEATRAKVARTAAEAAVKGTLDFVAIALKAVGREVM